MIRVTVRSRKYRSWLMVSTVPRNLRRYPSSHSVACRSRWFVGSSSSRMSVSSRMSRPRFTRVFSPPDKHANSRCRISLGMLRPLATLFTAVSVSQPPSPSNLAFSSPYRRSVSAPLSPCSIRRASASISSFIRNIRAKAVCKTSSTVYPSGYTGICEISPTRRPAAICTSPSSGSSSPVSIRNTVVFPAPFRPSSPTRSPLST